MTQATTPADSSLAPAAGGWHCCHSFYRIDRAIWKSLQGEAAEGIAQWCKILDSSGSTAPTRLSLFATSGHEADFGTMVMDPDPLAVDRVHQRLMSSRLGPALVPAWSFVSMTEISEYVPTVEQYGARLVAEGETPDSPAYEAKVRAYGARLEKMNHQRLTPEFPEWRSMCFYPMNKRRDPGANWFMLPKSERNRLMGEHAKSGMEFAGKVSQLITVSVGLDDWEWGVTLWASNPEYLKDIVYRMRFDEASAAYAEFGPFYVGYTVDVDQLLQHCQLQ